MTTLRTDDDRGADAVDDRPVGPGHGVEGVHGPTLGLPTTGRRSVERRVQAARVEALEWTQSPSNAVRVGTYLSSYRATSRGSGELPGRTLGDYTTLLQEWGVPGVQPPPDVGAGMSVRWSRSVTLAVLRHLRRSGDLR